MNVSFDWNIQAITPPKKSARHAAARSALSTLSKCLLGIWLATSLPTPWNAGFTEAMATATNTPTATSSNTPAVRTEGKWMVDRDGRVLLFRGMNVVYQGAPYYLPDNAEGFTEADADWLVKHGFNSVRLGVLFAGVMPEKGVIDEAYLEKTDRVVKMLTARGIYVILDFHQYQLGKKFKGEGFPEWSVYDIDKPLYIDLGFPNNNLHPRVQIAFQKLYTNHDKFWTQYAKAWQAVANKWKGDPYLLGYEIINEPNPGPGTLACLLFGGCPKNDRNVATFQAHMQNAIRATGAQEIVWHSPNILFGYGTKSHIGAPGLIYDHQNIGFSWHNYCFVKSIIPKIPSKACNKQLGGVFDNAETTQKQLQSASIMTEFGAMDDLDQIAFIAAKADEKLMSWHWWQYKLFADHHPEQSMFENNSDLGTVKKDKLKILVRPYPRATAGIPQALKFDTKTRHFSYSYTPRTTQLPTEIDMPPLHYPNGYELTVTGGTVVSAPNARLLKIRNDSGASVITVAASPR